MDLPSASETFHVSGPSKQAACMFGILNDIRKVS